MDLATLLALFSLASPAQAAGSPVSSFPAATSLSGSEFVYCIQGGVSKKCLTSQIQAYLLGTPNTWTATQTFPAASIPYSALSIPANSFTLSQLPQIGAKAVLGNATSGTANVTSPWTVSNVTDTTIPLVHGTPAAGDTACYSDTAGTLVDCTVAPITGSASGVALVNSTSKTVASIVLTTAGNWFCFGSANVTATSLVAGNVGLSTTTNAFGTYYSFAAASAGALSLPAASANIISSGSTTVYLVVNMAFSSGGTAAGQVTCNFIH